MGDSLRQQFSGTNPGDFGIIGEDVSYSLSPAMHNLALKECFKDSVPVYHAFSVSKRELPDAFELIRKQGLRGVNITVPYKEAALEHLNGLIGFAGKTGSVNTVSHLGGQLLGYNTDGDGFLRALEEGWSFNPRGRSALVLGTGGTGAVLIQKLLDAGAAHVFFWNRSDKKTLSFEADPGVLTRLWTVKEINSHLPRIDLVVNATKAGLSDQDGPPIEGLAFQAGQFVYDVVYHRETEFLKQAKAAKAKTSNGLGMLLHQGAQAFEIWTGLTAPVDIMRKGLKQQ